MKGDGPAGPFGLPDLRLTQGGSEGREPAQVILSGVVHYVCTVCESRMYRNRSSLDHEGRCDECAP